jgi:fructose-1,6-bisphosphatase I
MIASQRTSAPIILENAEDPKYALVFDPLDGSRNIEANVSVGSIFGILRIADPGNPSEKDLLQPGTKLVCAGYALYGDATLIVMTFGEEVNGFTLDPTIGEFVMTHKNIRVPKKGTIYSVNEGNFEEWGPGIQQYVSGCKKSTDTRPSMKLRYIGSMVADVHRTILYGGIFMYPKSKTYPNGKLGLLYEVNPLSFVVETAGGKASNGCQSPLNIEPTDIHQTSAVFVGSVDDVTALEKCIKLAKSE